MRRVPRGKAGDVLMKVNFDFSVSDLADAAERAVSRSRIVQGWRLEGRITWAALIGVSLYAITPGRPVVRAGFAVLFAAALVALLPALIGRSGYKSRMHKYYREQLGGDGPYMCEVELSPSGLVTRQLGVETRHAWPQVKSVVEVADGIEFTYRPMGSLLVRNRAFSSPKVRQQFLELAGQYLRDSGT